MLHLMGLFRLGSIRNGDLAMQGPCPDLGGAGHCVCAFRPILTTKGILNCDESNCLQMTEIEMIHVDQVCITSLDTLIAHRQEYGIG